MSKKNNKSKSPKKSITTKATVEPVVIPEPVVILEPVIEPVIVPVVATTEKKKRGRKASILYVNYVDISGNLLLIGRPSKETIRTRLAVMLRKDQPYDKSTHFSLAVRLPEDDDRYLTFKGYAVAPVNSEKSIVALEPAYQDRVQSGELVAA